MFRYKHFDSSYFWEKKIGIIFGVVCINVSQSQYWFSCPVIYIVIREKSLDGEWGGGVIPREVSKQMVSSHH